MQEQCCSGVQGWQVGHPCTSGRQTPLQHSKSDRQGSDPEGRQAQFRVVHGPWSNPQRGLVIQPSGAVTTSKSLACIVTAPNSSESRIAKLYDCCSVSPGRGN